MIDAFRSYLAWRRFQKRARDLIATARQDHKPTRTIRQQQQAILHAALREGRG